MSEGDVLIVYKRENMTLRQGEHTETHLQRQRSSDTNDDLLFIVIHRHKKRCLVNLRGRCEIINGGENVSKRRRRLREKEGNADIYDAASFDIGWFQAVLSTI